MGRLEVRAVPLPLSTTTEPNGIHDVQDPGAGRGVPGRGTSRPARVSRRGPSPTPGPAASSTALPARAGKGRWASPLLSPRSTSSLPSMVSQAAAACRNRARFPFGLAWDWSGAATKRRAARRRNGGGRCHGD